MKKEKWKDCNNNRLWSGLIIVMIGVVFLLRNVGINVPEWLLSWNVLIILIGLLVGYKRNFEGGGWLIMILVGGFFTFKDLVSVDMSKYYFASAFIILGLFLILKPKRSHSMRERCRRRYDKFHQDKYHHGQFNPGFSFPDQEEPVVKDNTNEDDILDSVNVFGGTEHNVYAKNFKGGDLVAIFGGCIVNLKQADFEGTVVLDVVAFFGGIKIIVPSSWEVKSEVTAVFGGVDDKRGAVVPLDDSRKILKINGVALFGGVEIRNF